MARPERFELPTLCFEGRCSIQLSYGRVDGIGSVYGVFCLRRNWQPRLGKGKHLRSKQSVTASVGSSGKAGRQENEQEPGVA